MSLCADGASRGFLGRRVADRRAADGRVIRQGFTRAGREDVAVDLRDPPAVRDLLRATAPDVVVHGAAYRELGMPYVMLPISVPDPDELSHLFAPRGATSFDRVGLGPWGWAVTTTYKAQAAAARQHGVYSSCRKWMFGSDGSGRPWRASFKS